jgi:hypothetical protein
MEKLGWFLLGICSIWMIGAFAGSDIAIVSGYNGTNYHPARIDYSTRNLETIGIAHAEVHKGDSFFIAEHQAIDDGNTYEYRIDTPNTTKWAHLFMAFSSTLETTVELYETTTRTAGNGMVEQNRNRNKTATTATTTFTDTPGGAGDGTLIWSQKFGADTVGASGKGAGQSVLRAENELVLKQNEVYLIKITSGTDANVISIDFNWYEHTDLDT